jgi:hypothetical protein
MMNPTRYRSPEKMRMPPEAEGHPRGKEQTHEEKGEANRQTKLITRPRPTAAAVA